MLRDGGGLEGGGGMLKCERKLHELKKKKEKVMDTKTALPCLS
jgi:hypothetical protein